MKKRKKFNRVKEEKGRIEKRLSRIKLKMNPRNKGKQTIKKALRYFVSIKYDLLAEFENTRRKVPFSFSAVMAL